MKRTFDIIGRSDEARRLPALVRWAAVAMAAVVLLQIFRFGIQFPQMAYYGILFLLNVVVMANIGRDAKPSMLMFAFWGMMWLSILMNFDAIPPEVQPALRTFAFCAVILAVGPFFQSPLLLAFRRYLLQLMNAGMCAMTLLSFAGYVLHFLPKDRQGFYMGCTWHSMILAALAGFSGINCLHEAMHPGISPKRQKVFIVFFVAAVIVTMLAASRASLGSLGCAALAYTALSYKGRLFGAVKVALTAAILGMVILQFTGNVTGAMRGKMEMGGTIREREYGESSEGVYTIDNLTASRAGKWADRWNEICHEPLFGVGAHSVRAEYCNGDNVGASGQIEPGNGWLFVFSSMGIIAFILFCVLVIKPIARFWAGGVPGSDACLLFGQMVFFAVYLNAEAHITAAGDFTFFYCWLVIAVGHSPVLSPLNQRTLQLFPSKSLAK